MEGEFPYLKLKASLRGLIGRQDVDTRIFRRNGDLHDFQFWAANLKEELRGNVLPALWVPEYVGVSRAAVHKRIKAGRLTMFVFELEKSEFGMLGQSVVRRKGDFAYCILSECDAWHEEIVFRKARSGPPELFS